MAGSLAYRCHFDVNLGIWFIFYFLFLFHSFGLVVYTACGSINMYVGNSNMSKCNLISFGVQKNFDIYTVPNAAMVLIIW